VGNPLTVRGGCPSWPAKGVLQEKGRRWKRKDACPCQTEGREKLPLCPRRKEGGRALLGKGGGARAGTGRGRRFLLLIRKKGIYRYFEEGSEVD